MKKTLLSAGLVLTAVAAGCFALTALSLGRPSAATLALVRTLRELHYFHGSRATIELGGRRYTARCGQHWGLRGHVADVVLDRGTVVSEVRDHVVDGGPTRDLAFDLAGCPRPLATWLVATLMRHGRVQLLATSRGQRVYEIRIPSADPPLDVYVARRTQLPLELRIAGRRQQGTSFVHYGEAR